MPKEKSCGLILFRRDKEIKYLLLHYELGHWGFVKGNIEKGEEEKGTISREVREETGITNFDFTERFKEDINYFYRREGKTIFKEVIFYLAETKEKEVKLSSEHIGFKWLGFDDALKQLTFKNAKDILKKANDFIGKL